MNPSTVLALQRTVGNRAVSRFLRVPGMQDLYEDEADRPAATPMGLGSNDAQRAAQAAQVVAQDPQSTLADAAEELSFEHSEKLRRRR